MRARRVTSMLLFAAVAVLAFTAGMALHGWSGEGGAATSDAVRRIDDTPEPRPIRLVKADPGRLQRRIRERPAPTAVAPAAPVPSGPAPTPAPVAPAAPTPAPVAPVPQATQPPAPAPAPQQDFDLPDQPPPDTFDSDN